MLNQKLDPDPVAIEYLANIMVDYMESERFFARNEEGKFSDNVLAELYGKYVQGDITAKRFALKRLGDICLIVSGFFSDSLKRKMVDVDYYAGMGGSAYWHLSSIHLEQSLFRQLALKFSDFVGVLEELSDRTGVCSNSDIIRVYEKWLLTGNDRLRTVLWEHGIAAPLNSDDSKD